MLRKKSWRRLWTFLRNGYFDLKMTEQILLEAKRYGLIPKLHADQLNAIGASELGARHNAISVDHLEKTTDAGIDALKNSQTIATVLPGCSLFLNHPYAPARTMIDAGIPVAIASDFNPGSQMCYSMQMMLTLACTQMQMTPEEAITAATLNGAAALGLSNEIGSIEIGKQADVVLYNVNDYRYIPYHYGTNHVWKIVRTVCCWIFKYYQIVSPLNKRTYGPIIGLFRITTARTCLENSEERRAVGF